MEHVRLPRLGVGDGRNLARHAAREEMQFSRVHLSRRPDQETLLGIGFPLTDLPEDLILVFDQRIPDQRLDALGDDDGNVPASSAQASVVVEQFKLRSPPSILPGPIDHLVRQVPVGHPRLGIAVQAQLAQLEVKLPVALARCRRDRLAAIDWHRLMGLRFLRRDGSCAAALRQGLATDERERDCDSTDELANPMHRRSVLRSAGATLACVARSSLDHPRIVVPPPGRAPAAIAAVFGGSVERARRFATASRARSPEILLAVEGPHGNYTHAAILSKYPGRTAMLLVTSPRTEFDRAVGADLVSLAVGRACELDALIVQSLVEPLRTHELSMFENGGLRPIGTLAYFERPRQRGLRLPDPPLPHGVTIRPYRPAERAGLLRLLEETYEDSLDCPGLSRMRPTQDILDGHMHTGRFEADDWLVMEVDGVPSGVALMSELPPEPRFDLVYFGLAKRARGRSLGSLLLDRSLARVADASVSLACDRANVPAMRLYQSRGFEVKLLRVAMVAQVAVPGAAGVPTGYPPGVDTGASSAR